MSEESKVESVEFIEDKHVQYVIDQDSHRSFEYWLSEHLRLNGLYWGVTTLITMNKLDVLPENEVIEFVISCWDEKSGGFGAFPNHDGHLLSTHSALQILKIYDNDLKILDTKRSKIISFVKNLQLEDGSFQGDRFGEVDTRFIYNAVSCFALLGELTPDITEPATKYILKCQNFDGGFGLVPGAESHAAQVFTCLAALAVVDSLHIVQEDTRLIDWLSERQVLPSGGFNGRPEKLPDVCYSWWVLSSLAMLGKQHYVDLKKLENFILTCQDFQEGGISDRPDNQTDIYHTCFGITGLSLIDYKKYNFKEIDPIYCMPVEVTMKFKKWKYNDIPV
ncbi:type II proteins geranylgeranyltransferase beta subunit [Scheffersomyces amazonensis]|uniref:type II proteins geranylgeranyltransferase beta subunit n=1 Tax=Scheffersomyces amazonensis TaxID=1078765 RepID=UPI00315C9236